MDVEMTPLNRSSSYQNSYLPESQKEECSEESKCFSMSTKSIMYLSLVFFLLASVGILAIIVASRSEKVDLLVAPRDDYLLKSGAASYCKTSCASSCASYESIYGRLCCDWTYTSDGGKSCSQSISKEGVCLCSSSNESPPSSQSVPPPQPSLIPTEIPPNPSSDSQKAVPVPVPAPKQHHRRDDDWNNDWFPPTSWLPFPPFEPITVPVTATPCKEHCEHACGWSQSNGVSLCCDPNEHGQCGMTQKNGKCFCS